MALISFTVGSVVDTTSVTGYDRFVKWNRRKTLNKLPPLWYNGNISYG
jgi:hypothetical protein